MTYRTKAFPRLSIEDSTLLSNMLVVSLSVDVEIVHNNNNNNRFVVFKFFFAISQTTSCCFRR